MIYKLYISLFTLFIFFSSSVFADVIKPTLVEVNIHDEHVELELFTNVEALITSIGTQYKNSINAPNTGEYDILRNLPPQELLQQFIAFEETFLTLFTLTIDGKPLALERVSVNIDDIGYTQRPRASKLLYRSPLTSNTDTLSWTFDKTYGDNALRYRFARADEYTWQPWMYLGAGETIDINLKDAKPASTLETFIKFVDIGFKHVIPLGLDHILFIITMALGVTSVFRALIYVSSFTLAHTITLGLATYQAVEVSAEIIEPIIALSIVVMAIDKLLFNMRTSYSSMIIFSFGLLHGLGFALMLREFVDENILVSLIGFNVGVEFAQVVVVLVVLAVFYIVRNEMLKLIVTKGIALSIALVAMSMFLERI